MCDEARKKFIEFEKKYSDIISENLSESDTRSKLIDTILIDILGWDENDIRREKHVSRGYYDYRVSIAGFSFIIEAKKQNTNFILPNSKKRKIILETIYKENKDVIDQIRDYLSDCGCDTGIITNGRQFIISKFYNTNGISWKKNQCIIYNGFDDIKDHFVEFWNTLSKTSVIENRGIIQLFNVNGCFSRTILSSITEKDTEIIRNDLSSKIVPLIDKSLGDIYNSNEDENNLDFIKECYVENKEVIKNKNELMGLFADEVPNLNEVIKARNAGSINNQISHEINSYPAESSTSQTPIPIIVIGSRGVGKTTFINYFLNKCTESVKSPYLIVNLMKYYTGENLINFDTIYEDLLMQFDDRYPDYDINSLKVLKRIYIKEINQNDKGIWSFYKNNNESEYQHRLSEFLENKKSNVKEHFMALNKYLTKEVHCRILLVFDNADQLSDAIQEQVYLNACSLNTQAKYGVIVSLREGYYYTWRNRPPFNAFVSNAYHITAPDYGEVLQKRLNYIINQIHLTKQSISGSIGNKIYTIAENKIEEFFVGINKSLFDNVNQEIIDFLRYLSFPNIREGLNLFKTFLISGYTNVSEYIMRVVYDDSKVSVPIHEFVKAVALENKIYYNHKTSKIQNIFYPSSQISDYFIKYYILKRLDEQLSFEGNITKFVNYREFLEEFQGYGYREDVLNQEIEALLKDNFIETDKVLSDIRWDKLPQNDFSITITAKGHYYITKLVNRFYYIELVLQDTPIKDENHYLRLVKYFPIPDLPTGKKDMYIRVKVVCLFMKYLEDMQNNIAFTQLVHKYGKIVDNINSYGLGRDLNRICNKMGYKLEDLYSSEE